MIIENEILEQIADDDQGWPFTRAFRFIAQHKDPWPVLQALHHDLYIFFCHTNGEPLEQWRVDEIFRNRIGTVIGVHIRATAAGIERAFN